MNVRPDAAKWIEKAESDWDVVEKLTAAGGPWDAVGFHAQQCAQKYLKSFLLAGGATPPRTHDVGVLLRFGAAQAPELTRVVSEAAELTGMYQVSRYPESDIEITEAAADSATAAARRIRGLVRELLQL